MGFGVCPPQGIGIKAVVYEFIVLKISDPLFYCKGMIIPIITAVTIWSPNKTKQFFALNPSPPQKGNLLGISITPEPFKGGGTKNQT